MARPGYLAAETGPGPAGPARAARRRAGLVALAAALPACLEYSPHAIPRDDEDRDVNARSLERLLAAPAPEVLRFAVVGDTQGDFKEVEEVVDHLNALDDLSLVIQVGDFTHLGLAPEYRSMNALFRRLRVPYVVVVGNHDLLANGGAIYDAMFGPRNLVFTYAGTRFVLLDTNSREYGFDGRAPDLGVLRAALAPEEGHGPAFLFFHVSPTSSDFDPSLREPFLALASGAGVRFAFHGHAHTPGEREAGGVRYLSVGAVDKRTFVHVSVHPDGRVDVERRTF